MGHLQKMADDYANFIVQQYCNNGCAKRIENWRNRITHKHDVDSFKQQFKNYSYRQAKQIVNYAKQYCSVFICSNKSIMSPIVIDETLNEFDDNIEHYA